MGDIEVEPVQIDQGALRASVDVGELAELDSTAPGLVVLDRDGRVESANHRAKELLSAEELPAIAERLQPVSSVVSGATEGDSPSRASLQGPGLAPVLIRSYPVGDRHVLILRGEGVPAATKHALQHASRHRVFAFFARDWAHDLKGMLHIIRINSALLGRLLQRENSPDPAVTRCLDAIPREVERLDRSIELLCSAGSTNRAASFDIGATCERVMQLIKARAARQHVQIGLEMSDGTREVTGFEDQIQVALLNLAMNALEAMPQEGRLLCQVIGTEHGVTIRVSDTGPGIQPELLSPRRLQLVNGGDRLGIGLFVIRSIVDAHGGRVTGVSNAPQGTCFEITLPTTASIERLAHGSRTDR